MRASWTWARPWRRNRTTRDSPTPRTHTSGCFWRAPRTWTSPVQKYVRVISQLSRQLVSDGGGFKKHCLLSAKRNWKMWNGHDCEQHSPRDGQIHLAAHQSRGQLLIPSSLQTHEDVQQHAQHHILSNTVRLKTEALPIQPHVEVTEGLKYQFSVSAKRNWEPLPTRIHHALCHHVTCLFDTWHSSRSEFASLLLFCSFFFAFSLRVHSSLLQKLFR